MKKKLLAVKNKLQKTMLLVAGLNFIYFAIEFSYALLTNSVSLMADSIDFLEDGAMNILVFFAVMWPLVWRRRMGFLLSVMMAAPAVATIWLVYNQLISQVVPEGNVMAVVSLGALVVNLSCAWLLLGHQKKEKSNNLLRWAYLSARNGAITNVTVIITGVVTLAYPSIWPDLIVGVFIALLYCHGAVEVYKKSRQLAK